MDDNVFARLVSVKEDGSDGTCVPLFRGMKYHIGRDVKCEIKVADPSVRAYQCCIDYVELDWGPRITPVTGAAIVVNGTDKESALMLQNGDFIRLGNKKLRIDVRRILPSRGDDPLSDETLLPQPLLVDTITPPRVKQMTVRPKTQLKNLLSSTKPPVVAVSKKAGDSPAKRQLFSDDDDENKVPQPPRRSGRKNRADSVTKSGSQVLNKKISENPKSLTQKAAKGPDGRKGKTKNPTAKKVTVNEAETGVRRSTRSASVNRSTAATQPTVRKSVRFSSKTKA